MGRWPEADTAIREMDAIAARLPSQHRIGLLARYARARWHLAQQQFGEAEVVLASLLPDMATTVDRDHGWTLIGQEMQVSALLGRSTGRASALTLARQLLRQSSGANPGDAHRLRATLLLARTELANGRLQPETLPALQSAIRPQASVSNPKMA